MEGVRPPWPKHFPDSLLGPAEHGNLPEAPLGAAGATAPGFRRGGPGPGRGQDPAPPPGTGGRTPESAAGSGRALSAGITNQSPVVDPAPSTQPIAALHI